MTTADKKQVVGVFDMASLTRQIEG